MSQPIPQMPPEPLAVMEPDDMDDVRGTVRPVVTDAVHPFAGLGLHVDCCRKDRLVARSLSLLVAVYARATQMRTRIGSFSRD